MCPCTSLFCRPSALCVFVTLVDTSTSFLTSAAFVLSCADLFVPVAPSDMPEQLKKASGECLRSGADVILTKRLRSVPAPSVSLLSIWAGYFQAI